MTRPPSRAAGWRVLAALAALLVVGGVLTLTLTGGPDLSSPAATARAWVEAANDGDLDGLVATFCPADRQVPEDARQQLAETRAAYPDMTYRVTEIRAVDATTVQVTFTYVDGPPPAGEQTTTSVLTARRVGDEWLFCGT